MDSQTLRKGNILSKSVLLKLQSQDLFFFYSGDVSLELRKLYNLNFSNIHKFSLNWPI